MLDNSPFRLHCDESAAVTHKDDTAPALLSIEWEGREGHTDDVEIRYMYLYVWRSNFCHSSVMIAKLIQKNALYLQTPCLYLTLFPSDYSVWTHNFNCLKRQLTH